VTTCASGTPTMEYACMPVCERFTHRVYLFYAGTAWGVTVSASTHAPTPGRSY